jgi:pimeloyl-ACP methyl ester carboxylesterase
MRTYRIDRLAADLAEVLTALRVTGPLTLAGHSMGGMTALAYLGLPSAERPVEPQGLVLIATAAGRLAERGIGRLLSTRATEMVFELVHHMPRRAVDRAINQLLQPLCDGLTKYANADWRGAAELTASAIRTTPLSTAAGFLPALKRYDQYDALPAIAANTIVISGGADIATPVAHARDMVAAIPGAAHLHQPTAGHMLLEEHPRCVSEAIDRVLEMQNDDTHSAAS